MPIIAKRNSGGEFIAAPAGTHRAVLVDVVDLGLVEQTWNGKTKKAHKVRLVWQIDELMPDGRLFIVGNRYTLSLDPKANLRKLIEGWTGKAFSTELEAEGFDVETLIGDSCILTVTHREANGSIFANVTGVAPLMKGMVPMKSVDYVRTINRDGAAKPDAVQEYDERNPPPLDDDADLNF